MQFLELTKQQRKECVANILNLKGEELLSYRVTKDLSMMFSWDITPQGDLYWRRIYHDLEQRRVIQSIQQLARAC